MPRPFLGQSNSQTGPQRSRLQGGVPQSSSSGPIAEGGLQAPALQALQQIVSTFQSPGRTNLGGPTEIPAAPRLQTPERTPTPQLPQAFEISKPVLGPTIINPPRFGKYYDGWGALVDSLGAFSRGLDKLSQGAIAMEESKHVRAKSSGQSLALQAQAQGFNNMQELQKHLERQAEEGVPGAEQMLQRVEGSSPLQLRYATVTLQDATLKNNFATLIQRLAETPVLADGTPIEQVHPMDPRWQQHKITLGFPQGVNGLIPEVHQGNQAMMAATFGSADSAQLKRHIEWKNKKAKLGLQASVDSNLLLSIDGGGLLSLQMAANGISRELDDLNKNSGTRSRVYQEAKKALPTMLVNAAMKWAGDDPTRMKEVAEKLPQLFNRIQAGPNGELLKDQLPEAGGTALTLAFQTKWANLQSQKDKIDKQIASNDAEIEFGLAMTTPVLDSEGNKTGERTSITNIVQMQDAYEELRKKGAERYRGDADGSLEFFGRIEKLWQDKTLTYIKPIQEENEFNVWFDIASGRDVNVDLISKGMKEGLYSQDGGLKILNALASRNREENKIMIDHLRTIARERKKKALANIHNNTPERQREVRKAYSELMMRGMSVIMEHSGKQITDKGVLVRDLLEKEGDNYFLPLDKVEAAEEAKVYFPDPTQIEGYYGSKANQMELNARILERSKPLVNKETIVDWFDKYEAGDKDTVKTIRELLRNAGIKDPNVFFKRELEKHGIPWDKRIKLKASANTDFSSAGFAMLPTNAGQEIVQPIVDTVNRTWQNFFNQRDNPTWPKLQPLPTIVGKGSKQQALATAAKTLGVDPADLAAAISYETIGTFDPGIAGGEGGKYEGLIQFGEWERKTYGVKPGMSFEEQISGPVVQYLKDRGVKPGHGVKEIYAAILTGNVSTIEEGGLDWKDSNNTSVNSALKDLLPGGGHYKKGLRFLQLDN